MVQGTYYYYIVSSCLVLEGVMCQAVSVTWGWGLGGSSVTGRGGPYQNLTANLNTL